MYRNNNHLIWFAPSAVQLDVSDVGYVATTGAMTGWHGIVGEEEGVEREAGC